MGLNFYLRKKISDEDKERLIKAIKEDDLLAIDNLTKCTHKIHIGKSSIGWKFHWDANYFQYFEPNKESILNWLKSGVIYDEEGDKYTYNEFIKFVEDHNANPENSWDASTYSHYCTMEGIYCSYHVRDTRFFDWFKDRYKIDVDIYGEFYIDDMRFCVDSNWS